MSRGLPPSRLSRIGAVILEELRKVENDPQIQQADVMEWSTETVKAQEGEKLVWLPKLGVNVAYKPRQVK